MTDQNNDIPPPPPRPYIKAQMEAMAKPFPGSVTPGWNDPPALTRKEQIVIRRSLLNKRVPFPIFGNEMNVDNAHKTTPLSPSKDASIEEILRDDELPTDALQIILSELNNCLKNDEDPQIDNIKVMWEADKFDISIKQKLYFLSKALQDKDLNAAMNLHTQLITQHSEESATWSNALKQVIQSLKTAEAETSF